MVAPAEGKAKWWAWVPVLGFGCYAFWSGDLRAGLVWMAVLGLGLLAQHGSTRQGWPRRWAAYGLNWFAPVAVAAGCAQRVFVKDYWGVAFFLIIFGFALVNAAFLEPSPRRTGLFRALTGLLGVVSIAAIWKTITP